jgi:hypothetical protein
VTITERTAVLVVRAWRDAADSGVRCRILLSDDVLSGAERSIAASGADEVCDVVRAWLDGVASGDAPVTSR